MREKFELFRRLFVVVGFIFLVVFIVVLSFGFIHEKYQLNIKKLVTTKIHLQNNHKKVIILTRFHLLVSIHVLQEKKRN